MNNNGIASQIIVDIITHEMGLPVSSVWIRDQSRKIPNDTGLYVIAGMTSSQVMASTTYMIESTGAAGGTDQSEFNEVQQRENIQIDILSRSNEAITRNWELVAALKSIYSVQQQETNDFKIARIPTNFLNTSAAEGGYQLNRYSLTFPVFVWYRKKKILSMNGGDYYDDFRQRVDDARTIATNTPMIEFEINQGGIVP